MRAKFTLRKNKNLIKISLRLILFLVCIFSLICTGKFIVNKMTTTNKYSEQACEVEAASEKDNIESNSDDKRETSANNNTQSSNHSSQFTVCIDPGHGGYDDGTKSFSGILEKNVTLKVALKVGSLLEKNNIKVVYTRRNDKVSWPSNEKADLRERVKICDDAKADIFVSLHCNANPKTSYKGVETWCRFPNTDGEKLAKTLQKEMANCNYTANRGVKYEAESALAVLRLNNSISALVEIGFLSNSSDAEFITSESGQDKCAQAVAKAIMDYKSSYKK